MFDTAGGLRAGRLVRLCDGQATGGFVDAYAGLRILVVPLSPQLLPSSLSPSWRACPFSSRRLVHAHGHEHGHAWWPERHDAQRDETSRCERAERHRRSDCRPIRERPPPANPSRHSPRGQAWPACRSRGRRGEGERADARRQHSKRVEGGLSVLKTPHHRCGAGGDAEPPRCKCTAARWGTGTAGTPEVAKRVCELEAAGSIGLAEVADGVAISRLFYHTQAGGVGIPNT